MLGALRYVFWALATFVLSLRYRVRVRGLEQVRGLRGPTLVLPNHPAYVDPPLVLTAVWPALRPRPMVFEGNFKNPALWPMAKLLDAVPVPDLEQASAEARARAEEAVRRVIEGLKKGENYILWPAGRTQAAGREYLGGARALADILRAVPEANLVLVRSRGLWGSLFSRAQTGKPPRMPRDLFRGAGILLGNLLFFAPRRPVEITVEKVDRTQLPELRRESLNPWFEEWYNRNGENPGVPPGGGPEGRDAGTQTAEQPTFVPYHFLFGPRTFEYPKLGGLGDVDLSKVKPETREAVNGMVADKLGRPLEGDEQKAETTFDDLGLDSLDRMELALAVEQRFGFSGGQSPLNLGQLWALAQGLAEKEPPKPPPPDWFRPPSSNETLSVEGLGDTIPAVFAARVRRHPRDVAAADDLSGVLTYERLLVGVLTMARRFRGLPAPNVGLMLPASVAGDVALLALQFAGKLPVLLNWTTGPANLAHAARVMGLDHVVTSRAFVDRSGVQVEGASYLFLEDVRAGITRFELLRTLLAVRLFPGRVRHAIPPTDPHAPAVVLFTSGSEKAPKAVPLTHDNILSNQRGGLPVLGFTRADSMLGFLPAFHSFGMNVTGLLPLLGGMRVVLHPDPTDASGLAHKIGAYKTTLLAGTPTFVSYILDRAAPGQLDPLRLIVVGAEKCPEALVERCKRQLPHAQLIEGYGITECSPVVSGNPPAAPKPGTIGPPFPNIAWQVVDLETEEPLGPGRMGMLWVSGPSVFPGYLAYDGPSPFRERDGRRWYVTGDLVEADADGYLTFRGRLKRFIKAGGEMISLPALEEPFARLYPPTKDGPRVAVEGVELPEGRRIVLFTTEPLSLRDANARLLEEGFRGVMRLDEVRRVDAIPVLGTGKTDYKVLRSQIESAPKA